MRASIFGSTVRNIIFSITGHIVLECPTLSCHGKLCPSSSGHQPNSTYVVTGSGESTNGNISSPSTRMAGSSSSPPFSSDLILKLVQEALQEALPSSLDSATFNHMKPAITSFIHLRPSPNIQL
ncbi:unnamed protein product [Linum trigynum]|uniref:Uncharacterized protein n=1 Tax=Linum trigynum TaxID=586398 RepID=A0AAV2EWU0_9ROSI